MSTPSLAALPIRRLVPGDLPACADLSEDRGWPRDEHKWGLLLTAGTGYGIDDPRGGLVAACVLTGYGPRDEKRGSAFGGDGSDQGLGAVGMMVVAKRYERQGVGRRLLRHLINTAGATPLTLYATPDGRPLYAQLGFTAIGRSETLRGHFAAAAQAPGGTSDTDDPSIAVRPAVAADLPAIVRLDGSVFGVDRTHMIMRLPAFADQVRVAAAGDRITGYAASWPTTTSQVIGPLVAENLVTAQALISSLAATTDRVLRTDIDTRHPELLAWLKEHGFATTAVNTVMTYGSDALPGDRTRNFAPLTVATG